MKKHLVLLPILLLFFAFLSGCGGKSRPNTTRPVREPLDAKDYGTPTVVNEVAEPREGDDPLTLTGVDNVLRIAYVLGHADNYTVDATSTVKAKVAFVSYTQNVKIYKDFCRGVLLEIDIANSSVVNDAWQSCFVSDVALLRDPDGGKKSWDGRDTVWDDGDPELFTRDEFREEYGLFGTELTNYILNADTIISWSSVTDNGDGTYTQTIHPDLTAATVDCARRMKKMGGLDKDPVFKDASITFTFDRNWRILSMKIDESYSIKRGILKANNCRAVTDLVYSYGNADISDFDSYFAYYLEE